MGPNKLIKQKHLQQNFALMATAIAHCPRISRISHICLNRFGTMRVPAAVLVDLLLAHAAIIPAPMLVAEAFNPLRPLVGFGGIFRLKQERRRGTPSFPPPLPLPPPPTPPSTAEHSAPQPTAALYRDPDESGGGKSSSRGGGNMATMGPPVSSPASSSATSNRTLTSAGTGTGTGTGTSNSTGGSTSTRRTGTGTEQPSPGRGPDVVMLPSLGDDESEQSSNSTEGAVGGLHVFVRSAHESVQEKVADSDRGNEPNGKGKGKKTKGEEMLHRSLLEARLELEGRDRLRRRRRYFALSSRKSSTSSSECTEPNTDTDGFTGTGRCTADLKSLRHRVSNIQRRVKTLPLFQLNSTRDVLSEIAPPAGLGAILQRNATVSTLAQRCAERSVASVLDLLIAVTFLCRAVYKTARYDGEIRSLFCCARRSIGASARQCLHAGGDDDDVGRARSATREEGGPAQRVRIAAICIGTSVAAIFLALWAFALGASCSAEACKGIGKLRDSIREASAAVVFGAATVVRVVGALGREIVARIRAAQLQVDS